MYFVLAWFKYFLLLNPLNVKSKYSGCEFFKCFVLLACTKICEYGEPSNKRLFIKFWRFLEGRLLDGGVYKIFSR